MPSAITLYRAAHLPSAPLGNNVTGNQQAVDLQGNLIVLPFPTNGSLDSVPFQIRVAGHYIGLTVNRTVQIFVYLGTSTIIANNSVVGNTGGVTYSPSTNRTNCNLVVELFVNGVTKSLYGTSAGYSGITGQTPTIGNATLNVDPNQDSNNQSAAPLGFTLVFNNSAAAVGEQFFFDTFELRV